MAMLGKVAGEMLFRESGASGETGVVTVVLFVGASH
jgi:hypothetical protein